MKDKKLHFRPKKNWMNDPNGLCYYKGEYHLYYQYFPYGLKWGTMHWGHATTTDFITYEHHPIALFPSLPADQNGVFSGSALIEDDHMNLFFTGVKYNDFASDIHRYGDKLFTSSQLKITSEDGFTFDNFNGKQIIIDKLQRPVGDPVHTRDPKVWKKDNEYYLLLGSNLIKNNKQQGALLFYKSDDLQSFEQIAVYSQSDMGHMWECPDYFEIDSQGWIVMSPEGTMPNCIYPSHIYIAPANFDYDSKLELVNDLQLIDIGLDCYAPQTFEDEMGNRVLISWIRMPEPIEANTIGAFTMPRVITSHQQHIKYHVHPLVASKFKPIESVSKLEIENSYRINCQLALNEYINIGSYKISNLNGKVNFNRQGLFPLDDKTLKQISTTTYHQPVDLEIYYDGYIVETFIDDGRFVCTQVVYDNLDLKIDTNVDYTVSQLERES